MCGLCRLHVGNNFLNDRFDELEAAAISRSVDCLVQWSQWICRRLSVCNFCSSAVTYRPQPSCRPTRALAQSLSQRSCNCQVVCRKLTLDYLAVITRGITGYDCVANVGESCSWYGPVYLGYIESAEQNTFDWLHILPVRVTISQYKSYSANGSHILLVEVIFCQ